MRALRWPRVWLGLWLLAIAVVAVLSLLPAPHMPLETPQNFDKLLHFLAYFGLAFSAVQLFSSRRALVFVSLGLIALGVLLEWAQGAWLPHLRYADEWDAVANTLGVVAGVLLATTPLARCLLRLEQLLGA